jgi:capsular polysaccharide biosynthesis protein
VRAAASYEANTVILKVPWGLAGLPELAESQRVLEDVINELHLSLTIAELGPKVSTSRINGSSLVRITMADSDPVMAISIENGFAKSYRDYIAVLREVSLASAWEEVSSLTSNLDSATLDCVIAQALGNLGYLVKQP